MVRAWGSWAPRSGAWLRSSYSSRRGFFWSHGSGPCGDGTTLLWLGLAAFSIGLALISLSVLALPGTPLFVFVGLPLLIGAGIEILVAGSGCHGAIFGYTFPR